MVGGQIGRHWPNQKGREEMEEEVEELKVEVEEGVEE